MLGSELRHQSKLQTELLATLGEPDAAERGGWILDDGTIVELQNVFEDPKEGCVIDPTVEQLDLLPRVVATWHTHPGANANLSAGDAETFCAWSNLHHAIVGTDGVRWYAVKNGAVVNA